MILHPPPQIAATRRYSLVAEPVDTRPMRKGIRVLAAEFVGVYWENSVHVEYPTNGW